MQKGSIIQHDSQKNAASSVKSVDQLQDGYTPMQAIVQFSLRKKTNKIL